jgi:hypothetical protein
MHARCATALPLWPDQAEVDIEGCLVGVGHGNLPYLGQDRNSQESSVLIVAASLGDLVETSANLVVCRWCLYSVPFFPTALVEYAR